MSKLKSDRLELGSNLIVFIVLLVNFLNEILVGFMLDVGGQLVELGWDHIIAWPRRFHAVSCEIVLIALAKCNARKLAGLYEFEVQLI